MKRLLALALAAAATLPAMPVQAQVPGPELERFYLRLASGPRELSRMTSCLVNQQPEAARALFDHDVGSPVFEEAQQRVFEHGSNCLSRSSGDLRASFLMAIGSVAEHLIAEDEPAKGIRPELTATFAGGGTFVWEWRNLTPVAAERLLPLAECLLVRHGGKVEAVLDARQTSNGEREAFNAMRAEIADCIPLGEQRTLQPQILRAALAITYYRAARAALASVETAG